MNTGRASWIMGSRALTCQFIEQTALPCVRLPGCDRVLIDPADLRRYMDAGRGAGHAAA
jgi:hypothetical protein